MINHFVWEEFGVTRVAIVEDDLACCKQLKEYLAHYTQETGETFSVRTFGDGDDIVNDYRAEYDIILMDIQMKHMDGMTAAEKIRRMDAEVVIVFITNLASYAVKSYTVEASDYLVKPVSSYAFSQSLNRVLERLRRRTRRYLYIKHKDGVQKVDCAHIYFIEVDGRGLIYHTVDGEISAIGTMREVETRLEGCPFFRCNKGYLVNLEYVGNVVGRDAIVHGITVQISRSKKRAFLDALNRYINEVM